MDCVHVGPHVACQAPLSMRFFRQEYWSGLPLPSPGDFPHPGIKPGSPAFRQILYHLSHQESLKNSLVDCGNVQYTLCKQFKVTEHLVSAGHSQSPLRYSRWISIDTGSLPC